METNKEMEINYITNELEDMVTEQEVLYTQLRERLCFDEIQVLNRLLELEHLLTKECDY